MKLPTKADNFVKIVQGMWGVYICQNCSNLAMILIEDSSYEKLKRLRSLFRSVWSLTIGCSCFQQLSHNYFCLYFVLFTFFAFCAKFTVFAR